MKVQKTILYTSPKLPYIRKILSSSLASKIVVVGLFVSKRSPPKVLHNDGVRPSH